MPSRRQVAESPVLITGRGDVRQARSSVTRAPVRDTRPLRVITRPDLSAIEFIVATARPGEVIHVDEADYYNPHLWGHYKGIPSRYSTD